MNKFKIGDKVVDKISGNIGTISHPADWSDFSSPQNIKDWYINWITGPSKGDCLWLSDHEFDYAEKRPHITLQQAMQGWNVTASDPTVEYTAADMLQEAKDCLVARGVERDKPNGERSMKSTVEAFNALTGHDLTEEHGWIFMLALKMARSQGGCYKADDYIDMAAYAALAGEAGANNAN